MGNARSSTFDENDDDIWWTNGAQQKPHRTVSTSTNEPVPELNTEREQRRKELAEDFENFKLELARKHDKRRQILAEKRREMTDMREELILEKKKNEELKEQLKNTKQQSNGGRNSEDLRTIANLKEENEDLRNEMEKLRLQLKEKEIISEKNKELRISLAEMQKELQSVNTEVIGFQKERIDYQEHVAALKDVVKVSKEMLVLRENQIEELRKKITSIEELLASKEMNVLSNDLREEYEKQLRNMRNLRTLYEERQRADKREKEDLQSKIEDLKKDAEEEQQKNSELNERISQLETENSERYDKIKNLESSLGISKAERKELQAEMAVINQLFSQILLSFNNDQEINLDKLIKILEENHDLLTNIVINEESNEVSALPKVLLDLINQVNKNNKESKDDNQTTNVLERPTAKDDCDPQTSAQYQLNSPEEIVENLPKVWRVLIELLSHQCAPNNVLTDVIPKNEDKDHPCYKSVQTPDGTRRVLSVSKTFIRLKDLILEKKFLEKEMTRLKQLNTHLEGRLQDQEKRLVLVSNELSKTWHVVGKMQKQHQQLHTQEKILRYELAQKRKLLTELKQELEYCREKWLQARKKNSCTEEQWKQLRTEFTSRKTCTGDDYNNSIESGFSDDKSSSEDEDPVFETFQKQEDVLTSVIQSASDNEEAVLESTIDESNTEQTEGNSTSELIEIEENTSDAVTANGTKEAPHSLETQKTDLVQNVSQERQVNSVLPIFDSQDLHSSEINQEADTLTHEDEVSPENILQTAKEYIRSHTLTEDDSELQSAEDTITYQDEISPENILQTAEEYIRSHTLTEYDSELQPAEDTITHQDEISPENILQTAEEYIRSHTLTEYDSELHSAEEYIRIHSFTEVDEDEAENIFKTAEEFVQNHSFVIEDEPSTSTGILNLNTQAEGSTKKTPSQSAQEFVARREARMKRLEEQCKQLYFKAASTAIRSLKISNKLDNLHETYGENKDESVTECEGSTETEESNKQEQN